MTIKTSACERFWGKLRDWIGSVENQLAEVEWKALAKAADCNLERLGQARDSEIISATDKAGSQLPNSLIRWRTVRGVERQYVTNLSLICCALSVKGKHPSIYGQNNVKLILNSTHSPYSVFLQLKLYSVAQIKSRSWVHFFSMTAGEMRASIHNCVPYAASKTEVIWSLNITDITQMGCLIIKKLHNSILS